MKKLQSAVCFGGRVGVVGVVVKGEMGMGKIEKYSG
jgi:hypothetical protein